MIEGNKFPTFTNPYQRPQTLGNFKQLTDETILDALQLHVEAQGEKTAYTFLESDDSRVSITYRELDGRARRIACVLLENAKPGDRALMMYPAGLDFIEAFLGCLYAGIVAVPAYPPVKNRNAARILAIAKDCDPKLLLCTTESIRNVEGEFANSISGSIVVETDKKSVEYHNSLPQLESGKLAFLQYTSGSTSAPKGVSISHGNLLANEVGIHKQFDFTKESVMVSWLPMFHDMGLIGCILSPLFVGYPSILMAPNTFLREPVEWLRAVTEFRGTCIGAPNFAYDLCLKKITNEQKKELDLSSLNITFNGAEPVRADTLARFNQSFAECGLNENAWFPCYGMAETTLIVSGGPPLVEARISLVDPLALERHFIVDVEKGVDEGQKLVGCGQIGPDLEARIVHPEAFIERQADEVGEIWLHGTSVAKGYWNRPDETTASFQAKLPGDSRDWFRTGDYGFIRDDELYVTGRLKDLIIIRGRNIYPQDIELIVEQHLDFVEPNGCAVFSVQIEAEESLVVVIEGTRSMVRWAKDKNKFATELTDLKQKIAALRTSILDQFGVTLKDIVFVRPATFPRTSSGKVQRQLCRKLHLEDELNCLQLEVSNNCELIKKSERDGVAKRNVNSTAGSRYPQGEKDYAVFVVKDAIESWANDEGIALSVLNREVAFNSLPLDSIATIDVVTRIEKSTSAKIQPGILLQYKTIGALADYLAESKLTLKVDTTSSGSHHWASDSCVEQSHGETTSRTKDDPAALSDTSNSSGNRLLYNFQQVICLTAPMFLASFAALSPLVLLSDPFALIAVCFLSPLIFFLTYLLVCCCLGRCYSGQITAGQFTRCTLQKKYRNRRLYGACWCAIYYFGPFYNIILSLPMLKKIVFRSFGYSGSLNWNIYPDTWIRDLPLLHIGEDAYIANKATLGTNLPLKGGQILVDHIRIGTRSMIGHLAMIGAGTEIGNDTVVGHGCVIGIYVSVGPRSDISPLSALDSFVQVGKDCSIGVDCVIHQGVVISDGLTIQPSSVIPQGVSISSQQEADAYAPS